VVCTLPSTGSFQDFNCSVTVEQMALLLASGMYFNLHTSAYPGGGCAPRVPPSVTLALFAPWRHSFPLFSASSPPPHRLASSLRMEPWC
jgi:hypothetical protein